MDWRSSLLGLAHLLVAVVLLPLAGFFGCFSMALALPGIAWLVVLGVRLMRSDRSVRKALRSTHLVLGPLAVLLVIYGLYCLRAAAASAEAGGGLLGAFGLIPIAMGVLTGCLSVIALWASRS
jgi:hypothetical protein